jgi:hypothetical protein
MKDASRGEIPREIEQARRRFERWRKNRKKITRIPERLWAAAVSAARLHGVNPTSIALGLDYNHLKRRMESRARATAKAEPRKSASFVELIVPPESRHLRECMIELENVRGVKMKIHLSHMEMKDLAVWSRTFWDQQG